MKVQNLWNEVRYGLRTLGKNPGFTLVAIITLALGIGANTAIFSAVDRILLNPLPYPQPNRIMAISREMNAPGPMGPNQNPGQQVQERRRVFQGPGPAPAMKTGQPGRAPHMERKAGPVHAPAKTGQPGASPQPEIKAPPAAPAMTAGRPSPAPPAGTKGPTHFRIRLGPGEKPGGKSTMDVFSYPDFEDLRANSAAFEEVAAYHEEHVTLTRRGEPASISAVVASAALFRLLRTKPVLGRLFTTQDDREGAAPVAMIGERLWRDRFSADPGVISGIIELNNRAFTVVGVLPASLRFPPFVAQAQAWIPLVSDPVPQVQQLRSKRGFSFLSVIGRLKPGVTIERANAELSTLAGRLAMTYPEEDGGVIEASPLARHLVKDYRLALLVLLAAVGLVLLIACVNVANLLLARASVRERELALRLAIGAGRARVIRQMLVESLELAVAGGAAGVFIAYLAVAAFVRHLPPTLQEFQGVTVSGSVLAFAAFVSMGAGIAMGLLPAWRLSDLRIHEILKGSGGVVGSTLARGRLREVLVMMEVALAVVLLSGAGLLLRSFGKLVSVPLGFRPQGVMMARADLPAAGYKSPQQWQAFASTALQRLRAQPGVLQAAAAGTPPMSGMRMVLSFSIPGQPLSPDNIPVADYRVVTPGYFSLMRIPLLRGRPFLDTDSPSAARVCVVDQAFVERYFPSVDPLTQQLHAGMPPESCQIVGVVGNVISGTLSSAPAPAIYMPFDQQPFLSPAFLVRSGNPAAMASVLREDLHALNPALPIAPVTLSSLLSGSLEQDRLRTTLVALMAALAVLLAAVGISGVLGYSVTRRTQEIGVRMAMGATPREVLNQVVGEGFRLVAVGAVVGVVAALGLTRFMQTLLYGIGSADVVTYAGVALVLLVVALGACALPALRASRVDPTVALRYE